MTPPQTLLVIAAATAALALLCALVPIGLNAGLANLQQLVGRPPPTSEAPRTLAPPSRGIGVLMSKTRLANRQMIAHRAAARLEAIESTLDAALQELGLMCAELPSMRQEAQLAAAFGQDLFESAGQAYASLAEVRRHAVRLHEGFERVRIDLRLSQTRAGSGTDKPPYDESVEMRDVA